MEPGSDKGLRLAGNGGNKAKIGGFSGFCLNFPPFYCKIIENRKWGFVREELDVRGKSKSVCAMLLCSVCLWLGESARADLMGIWAFGPDADGYTEEATAENMIGSPLLVLFGGEKDINGKGGVEYTDAEGTYHAEGRAGAWDNVTSDTEWTLTVNTTNWQDMVLRWDYNSENDPCDLGPESFDFEYRVGGAGGYLIIINNQPITRDNAWHEFSYDLSLLPAIENEPIVRFRIRDLNRDTESGGYFKMDNIELVGTTSTSVSLLTPNGGERLIGGSTFDITWQTGGGTITDVLIEYSFLEDPNNWMFVATAPNTSLYEWEVADANSTQSMIRVADAENHNANDTNDEVFSIYRCTLVSDLNYDCFIDMLDFNILFSEWLQCGDPFDPECLQ
jgi:hypothetical protein